MVNRQGLVENDYYNYFIRIIESSISDFEHYRQSIIRAVNKKNKEEPVKEEIQEKVEPDDNSEVKTVPVIKFNNKEIVITKNDEEE